MNNDPAKPYNNLPLLPPKADVESKAILKKTISAGRALAGLAAGRALPNRTLLLNAVFLLEAKESSEIENIVTTGDDLYQALAGTEKKMDPSTKEVMRYANALWRGMQWIREKPISTNLFLEIVQTIKQNSQGIRNTPGTKVYNKATGEVVYRPPEGEDIIYEKLRNLEDFIHNNKDQIDPLVKMAIIHYQFEAIHPFADGNGRTGRILNILYLVQENLLESPILYLSRYIIQNKSDYYQKLRDVTEKGDWEGWILYMLEAIEETAIFTKQKMEAIYEAMENMRERMKQEISFYSKDLVGLLFEQPYCKIKFLVEAGIAKQQTAGRYLTELESKGFLKSVQIGREKLYINVELLKILKQ